MNAITVPEILYVFDVDRTLLDTELSFDVVTDASEAIGIASSASIRAAAARVKKSGDSFDTFEYLSDRGVSEAGLSELHDAYVDRARRTELLYPDARPVLNHFAGRLVLLTKGGVRTQTAKLEGSDLSGYPYLITHHQHKGTLIDNWRQDSYYQVSANNGEMLRGRSVILVDNNLASFKGLPEDCDGIWLCRDEEPSSLQLKNMPRNVRVARNLFHAAAFPLNCL